MPHVSEPRWRLPVGRVLAPGDFRWRHQVICVLLLGHLPILVLAGLLRGSSALEACGQVLPALALLLVAVAPLPRRVQSSAATLGLVTCSALLVHVFDGATEMHFHYFVVVAAIALYQDWAAYALVTGFVLLQHGLFGPEVDGDSIVSNRWGLSAIQAGFILAESAVLVLFWQANETARADQERLRDALDQGQHSVQEQLQRNDQIRADLIGTVSHEFRTPLTGIRGAALTLLKRGGRLDDKGRTALLRAIIDQQERLSRLLENMLTAAQATAADPSAAAEVDGVAAEVVMLAGAARPECPAITVAVEPQTTARIDRQALHQVLANLIDNAQLHGAPGAVPVVAGGTDDQGVWLSISNEGTTLDAETARQLFEPFTQADTSATRQREGLGMGLYVVRRLVEVHHGSIKLVSDGGWTTVELRLRSATVADPQAAGAHLAAGEPPEVPTGSDPGGPSVPRVTLTR
ncbi:MAG: hypothetical protein JWL64_2495 [Frankiales bacterium]|nr:hypothetical protein [Frankiales bacterium]